MDQRAGVMAGGGMDDHARGLVDDRQVVVLIENVERNLFRGRVRDVSLRDLELDHVTHAYAIRGIGRVAVDPDQVALDQPRRGRAAQVDRVLGQEAVQARGRGLRYDSVGLRNRYPAIKPTTPMLIAESATLNTGQKWTLTKSVTVPCTIRSYPLPSVPPRIRPRTASFQRLLGLRTT